MPITRVRPGQVIRNILTRTQPVLPDNILVDEATPSDMYRTYIELVKQANEDQAGETRQRGMSRHSFTSFLYQVKRLGLIVPAREEEAVGLPSDPRSPLLNIDGVRDNEPVPISERRVIEARRLYYRIGDGMARYTLAWNNIPKAYMELIQE